MEEIFRYWQKMYGKWPTDVYDKHLTDFRNHVARSGREFGIPRNDQEFLDLYYFLRNRTEVPRAPGWTPERERCAPGCYLHGTCNQELGRCDCPRGRQGPDCSEQLATSCREYCQHDGQCHRVIREWCINECNGRGSCVGGFCHCWPGYFGTDCSLSVDYEGKEPGSRGPNTTVLLAGQGYRPNPRGPKIYVYEFPPQYHVWSLLWLDRPLNIIMWERLMSLGLRTVDPEEADYFFLPGCGRGCNKWDHKFKYIMENYAKYWNRRNGHDHLMTHAGDWGRCEKSWGPESAPFIANLTMLNHWGITVDRSQETEHDLFKACHIPDQDIQVPVLCGDLYTQFEYNVWHPKRRAHPVNKTVLASVAGSICGWNSAEEPPCKNKYYSFGVRAALWTTLRDKPGFNIAKRVPVLGQSMAESDFCFAPTGAGHGKRQVVSVTLGCMPVIISDHVAQPFEPFLDWNDFGVWIAEADLPDVETILRGFTPQQKAAKMEKLYCAARHVAYTSVFGGLFDGDTGEFDAIATIVNILRVRLRHPGVPDHKLMKVDPDFADFMACKARSLGDSSVMSGAAAPPAPPLPNAAINARYKGSVDDTAFPKRTVTTAAWIKAVTGGMGAEASQQGQPSTDAATIRPGPLCAFNNHWVAYASFDTPGDPSAELGNSHRGHGQCWPKNANRPGNFPPGGSITCPPIGPITECAVLV
ncbi:hypothetical protein HXX76_012561 [Chlamydomonas incerta]|uniref:EGF-like domain-containing protein n=1 Tax=Chlamydomonas incerta TaxID=51695 RepID=A0A835VTA8_CHLIN|nr:hypothetical protein HXX76_012561 [Chlamydomonas incerta]|eukprot:KAG2427045.1 hypothetical protein HXX76_012561 [Chlamydomonas incerta]